jgi:hypothetical protein
MPMRVICHCPKWAEGECHEKHQGNVPGVVCEPLPPQNESMLLISFFTFASSIAPSDGSDDKLS